MTGTVVVIEEVMVVGTGVATGELMGVTGVGCCHLFPRDRTADKDGRGRSEAGGDSKWQGLLCFSSVILRGKSTGERQPGHDNG